MQSTLREITTPLLVGNITTVGAFLALMPLKSIALRDLGLFASFLLVGTILFVLIYLPHLLRTTDNRQQTTDNRDFLSHLASVQVDRKRWLVILVAMLTLIFGYFSLSVKFDSDVSNINYMTAEQKEDMAYFQKFFDGNGSEENVALYLLSSATDFDGARNRNRL